MMPQTLTVLGLESSCDDTAAAVLRHVPGQACQILSSVVKKLRVQLQIAPEDIFKTARSVS